MVADLADFSYIRNAVRVEETEGLRLCGNPAIDHNIAIMKHYLMHSVRIQTCSRVSSQQQSAIICNIIFKLVVNENIISSATFDCAVNQIKCCAVCALDPNFNTVVTACESAVFSCAAGCVDVHCNTNCHDVNVLHVTDNIFFCCATVVCLDTIGQARARDGHILDGVNTDSRSFLKNDTADGCAGSVGNFNCDILNRLGIPYFNNSICAGINDVTIDDATTTICLNNAITAVGCDGITIQIQGNRFVDIDSGAIVCKVVFELNYIAGYRCRDGCIQFRFCGNLNCGCRIHNRTFLQNNVFTAIGCPRVTFIRNIIRSKIVLARQIYFNSLSSLLSVNNQWSLTTQCYINRGCANIDGKFVGRSYQKTRHTCIFDICNINILAFLATRKINAFCDITRVDG